MEKVNKTNESSGMLNRLNTIRKCANNAFVKKKIREFDGEELNKDFDSLMMD